MAFGLSDEQLLGVMDYMVSRGAHEKFNEAYEQMNREERLNVGRDYLAADYNLIYKVLTDINQPYPGATYPDLDGIA